MQRAAAAYARGDWADAERVCRSILAAQRDHFDALHLLGILAARGGRTREAADLLLQAVSVNPGVANAHYHRGVALDALHRHAEALQSYDRALALAPDHARAHNNRGVALDELGRHAEALASYDRALAVRADYAEAHNNRGVALNELQRHAEALESLGRALALKPDYAEAHNNRGVAFAALQRHADALACYDRALALSPDFADAHNNRGTALGALQRHAEALASYERALELRPDYAEALRNRGVALGALRRYADVLESYERALALEPDHPFLYGRWLHAKMKVCDWSGVAGHLAELDRRIARGEKASPPFAVLALSGSPAVHRKAAEIWVAHAHPARHTLPEIAKRPRRARMRIGYFSADFREHAVSHLLAGLIEHHDRSRFEVTGFAFGRGGNDAMTKRLAAAFDAFVDARARTDSDVALLARELGIDVAVDLMGFTQDARTNIFAHRAAPIQVGFLGYPGTMGAPYIDYVVADATLIPDAARQHYAEAIAYLPHSYQPNDRTRRVAERTPARDELGLAEAGFVFCCFNNGYKILPVTFDRWMRILGRIDRSVLWLLDDNEPAKRNLRKEAERRGIGGDRLVFAPLVSMPEHLARHRAADLFLDTWPYNAHTTASDALWTGLPVLTCPGDTFASRVAASLLHAVGQPELVAGTPEQYERLAIELATDRHRLIGIRQRLTGSLPTAPLFDIRRFAAHIEAAFTAMYDRHQAGLAPAHLFVPD